MYQLKLSGSKPAQKHLTSNYATSCNHPPKTHHCREEIFKYFLLFILLVFATQKNQAQSFHCGNEDLFNTMIANNTTAFNKMQQTKATVNQFIAAHGPNQAQGLLSTSLNGVKLIPIVFHIISDPNNTAAYNITNSNIYTQLSRLNTDFAPYHIQFCLATKDISTNLPFPPSSTFPLGVFQHSITTASSFSSHGTPISPSGQFVGSIPTLPLSNVNYLQVYLVDEILNGTTQIAGAAPGLVSANLNDQFIIMNKRFCGDETLDPNLNLFPYGNLGKTLTHEIGHHFGLYHPFQSSNCTASYNCLLDDDGICDTPPIILPSVGCMQIMACMGTLPYNADNFMDYHYDNCKNHFTVGQQNYMHSYLNINNFRYPLWQPNNIIGTGTDNGCTSLPINYTPYFIMNNNSNCIGNTINFQGFEYGNVSLSWNMGDGTLFTGNPISHSYTSAGIYTVTLTATTNPPPPALPVVYSYAQSVNITSCAPLELCSNNWHFGENANLVFQSNQPPLAITANSNLQVKYSSITQNDLNGNLFFYSDGISVFNSNNQIINTVPLPGNTYSAQAGISITDPSNAENYYLFTTDNVHNTINTAVLGRFSYTLITKNTNTGLAQITTPSTLINTLGILPTGCTQISEQITAIPKCNGNGHWIIVKGFEGDPNFLNSLLVFELISVSGITQFNYVNSYNIPNSNIDMGQLKASPDGSMIALTGYENYYSDSSPSDPDVHFNNSSPRKTVVLSFNKTTGIINVTPLITAAIGTFGVSFSANSTYLYISDNNIQMLQQDIYQFDLTNPVANPSLFYSCPLSIRSFSSMALGPDNNIYVSQSNNIFYTTFGSILTTIAPYHKLDAITNANTNNPLYSPDYVDLRNGQSFTLICSTRSLPNFVDANRSQIKPNIIQTPLITSNCVFNTVQLQTNLLCNRASGLNYSWSPNIGLNNANIDNPIATIPAGTTYTVTVTDPLTNCTGSANVLLITPSSLNATISNNPILVNCPTNGSAVQLFNTVSGGSNNYSYSWAATVGSFSNSNITNPILYFNNTTSVTLTVTDLTSGCIIVSNSLLLFPNPTSSLNATINSTFSHVDCNNNVFYNLGATVTGGSGSYLYNWYTITTGITTIFTSSSSSTFTSTLNTNLADIVYLAVTDINTNCVFVTQVTLPAVTNATLGVSMLSTAQSPNCHNIFNITTNVSNGSGNYIYSWLPCNPTVSFCNIANPTITPTTVSTYILNVYDNNTTCSTSASIIISPNPIPSIPVNNNVPIVFNCTSNLASTTITAIPNFGTPPYSTPIWTPSAQIISQTFTTPNTYNATVSLVNGANTFTFTCLDANGCIGTGSVTVNLSSSNFTITSNTASSIAFGGSTNISNGLISVAPNVTLTIDNPMVFTNCNFYMNDNSKIELAGNSLDLMGCTLFNQCGTQLWQGIYADAAGEIITVNNTTIKDAYHALDIANEIAFALDANTFEDNYTGLNIATYSSFTAFAGTIYNNVFIQNNNLKPSPLSANSLKAHSGILATNVNLLAVGSNTLGGNTFTNTIYGIYGIGTNVKVYNNVFNNHAHTMAAQPPWQPFATYTGAGIKILSGSPGAGVMATSQQIIGGYVPNMTNTFNNCYYGVDISNSANLNINKNTFNNIKEVAIKIDKPITKLQILSFWPVNYNHFANNIKNNTIQNSTNGIRVSNVGAESYINIATNHIDCTTSNAWAIPQSISPISSKGIYIAGIYGTSQYRTNITYSDINKTHTGIEVKNIKAPYIFHNAIEPSANNISVSGTTFQNTGIKVNNCNGSNIYYNSIDGQFHITQNTIGIAGSLNGYSTTHCNVSSLCGIGIHYLNQNSLSTLLGNDFQDCKNGFLLTSGYIGHQGTNTFSNFNKWTSNGIASTILSDIGMTGSSVGSNNRFYVPSGTSVYNPLLLTGGAFAPTISPTNTDDCPELLNNNGENWAGKALAMLNGESIITGYDESSETIGKLQLYQLLTTPSEHLDDNWIDIKYEILSQDYTKKFVTEFANSDLGQLEMVNQTIADNLYDEAAGINNSINPNSEIAITQKEFNVLLIQYLKDETVLSNEQFVSSILQYANLCALQFGSLVFQAQALYNVYDANMIWEDENNCGTTGQRMTAVKSNNLLFSPINNPSLNSAQLFPNPAIDNTTIYISCKEKLGLFELKIYNTIGQIVLEQSNTGNCNSGIVQVDVSKLKTGNYLIELNTDKKLAYRAKLFVIK
jgi:hypothetical protein